MICCEFCGRFLSFLHLCMYQLKEIFSLNELLLRSVSFCVSLTPFSHLVMITAWRTEVMGNAITFETFWKLWHRPNCCIWSICCRYSHFHFSFANDFLHWTLSNWNHVISNCRYLFLVCQFIFDVSGLIILWFSYFWLASVAPITLLDQNK